MENIKLNFGAISMDNATLKGEGYRFYEGLLAQMRQFKESPVQVIHSLRINFKATFKERTNISNAKNSS